MICPLKQSRSPLVLQPHSSRMSWLVYFIPVFRIRLKKIALGQGIPTRLEGSTTTRTNPCIYSLPASILFHDFPILSLIPVIFLDYFTQHYCLIYAGIYTVQGPGRARAG